MKPAQMGTISWGAETLPYALEWYPNHSGGAQWKGAAGAIELSLLADGCKWRRREMKDRKDRHVVASMLVAQGLDIAAKAQMVAACGPVDGDEALNKMLEEAYDTIAATARHVLLAVEQLRGAR